MAEMVIADLYSGESFEFYFCIILFVVTNLHQLANSYSINAMETYFSQKSIFHAVINVPRPYITKVHLEYHTSGLLYLRTRQTNNIQADIVYMPRRMCG